MEVSRAIDLIDDKMCWGRGTFSVHHMPEYDEYWQAGEMAIDALKKQEQERWIPVTERLPEENGRYIICYEDTTTFLDYFNGKWFFPLGKHAMACEETGTIVAWRPLPEPFREEE